MMDMPELSQHFARLAESVFVISTCFSHLLFNANGLSDCDLTWFNGEAVHMSFYGPLSHPLFHLGLLFASSRACLASCVITF